MDLSDKFLNFRMKEITLFKDEVGGIQMCVGDSRKEIIKAGAVFRINNIVCFTKE